MVGDHDGRCDCHQGGGARDHGWCPSGQGAQQAQGDGPVQASDGSEAGRHAVRQRHRQHHYR